jgi:hypothetical protein
MLATEENVHVVVRIRPMQTNEKKNGDIPCVKAIASGREVQVKVGPLEAQNYRCHKCFNADTSQETFFNECGITELLNSTADGYRSCAFAYGQTGAGIFSSVFSFSHLSFYLSSLGKTFTMVGGSGGSSRGQSHHSHFGLVTRSIGYLFDRLNALIASDSKGNIKYSIKLSCIEIYQEHVYDLFAEEKEKTSLPVREHQAEGFFLEGLKLIECKDATVACSVVDMAVNKNRQVGFHDLNARSSRSHCLTDIFVEIIRSSGNTDGENRKETSNKVTLEDLMNENYHESRRNDGEIVRGKMSLIDLAGSERLKNTNSTGKVLQEAGFINKSLYVLGKVIAGLVRTNGDLNHKDVPYRDSKLTKLLINSLGGNSRTLLIACVSEAKGSQAETLRTLKFR